MCTNTCRYFNLAESWSDSETLENDAEGLHVHDCHQIMPLII